MIGLESDENKLSAKLRNGKLDLHFSALDCDCVIRISEPLPSDYFGKNTLKKRVDFFVISHGNARRS